METGTIFKFHNDLDTDPVSYTHLVGMNLRTGWSKEIWKGVCNNMASIRERNGKFNVIYSYTNEKGERKQKWETYETKAEAKRRKKENEYKKEMGSFVVRKCKTLDELITEYVCLLYTSLCTLPSEKSRDTG